MKLPSYHIDPQAFWNDPYPDLERMRDDCPIAYVPELDATLVTRHADIKQCEKNTEVFSSSQPDGLMTVLMGENLMRKDGRAHMAERRAIYPSMSPKAVATVWREIFESQVEQLMREVAASGETTSDVFWSIAMPASANALREVTGLVDIDAAEMNHVSQGMIDGCANYSGDPEVEAHCHKCTAIIDQQVLARVEAIKDNPDHSLISHMLLAGLPLDQIQANIKLNISGGQNEPRDAIAGVIWTLLRQPEYLAMVQQGEISWLQVFEEYARWISPIGMTPRRVAKDFTYAGIEFKSESRVFLMFSSGNRDADVFENPNVFDPTRDVSASLSFGAGPHFCAGAWISKTLIAEVVLPRFFAAFPKAQLDGDVPFGGWAFRGPLSLPLRLN